MRKWLVVSGLVATAVAGGFALLMIAFILLTRHDETPRRIPSPDGSRTLLTEIEQSRADMTKYKCVKFAVTDARGKVEYEAATGASNGMRWSLAWSGDNRIELRSSDIGDKAWSRDPEGRWGEEPASVRAAR